jgi:predicted RNA-binding protein with RPS1 domain
MAGGEGAKERRRLKRLAATSEGTNKSDDSQQRTVANENTRGDHSNKRTPNYSDTKRRKPDGQQRFNKNNPHHRTTPNPKYNNATKEKKPKRKKPKHLKRKLEQASNENGEAKEVIQKKIEQFETKKKFYSKQPESHKRQKPNDIGYVHNPNNITDGGAASRLNGIKDNCSPFPRSEKVKSAVIEDNNIEMTDHKETAKPKAKISKAELKTTNAGPKEDSTNDSSKVEIKKSAVIEDNNIEMTDPKETAKPKAKIGKDELKTTIAELEEDSIHDSSDEESVDGDAGGKTSSESIELDNAKDKSGQSSDDDDRSDGNSGSGSDDDSDDDTDDDEPAQQRQRGRRRRGRLDTAKKIEEMEAVEKSIAATSSDGKSKNESEGSNTKRYCIGRKPVTDFVLGQTHSARVVYVKPFGVFFDIGCHSDAFCHVSRLSDDFIKSPELKFKEGDEIPKVRIVEIDRKQKRITISLQSDARIEDERQSIEARKSRKQKKKNKPKKTAASTDSSGHDRSENFSIFNSSETTSVSKELAVRRAVPVPTPMKKNIDPSMMTPAELKRARKLARRAERRGDTEEQAQDS